MQPKLMRKMAMPSTFQTNFSLRIQGARIALRTMVKLEVEEINRIFPYPKAIALNA